MKYLSRKFLLAIAPLLYAIADYAATGLPPDGKVIAAAVGAIITYIVVEGFIDVKALVMALVMATVVFTTPTLAEPKKIEYRANKEVVYETTTAECEINLAACVDKLAECRTDPVISLFKMVPGFAKLPRAVQRALREGIIAITAIGIYLLAEG